MHDTSFFKKNRLQSVCPTTGGCFSTHVRGLLNKDDRTRTVGSRGHLHRHRVRGRVCATGRFNPEPRGVGVERCDIEIRACGFEQVGEAAAVRARLPLEGPDSVGRFKHSNLRCLDLEEV